MSEINNASSASEATSTAGTTDSGSTSQSPSTPSSSSQVAETGSSSPSTPPSPPPPYTPNYKFKYPKLDSNDQEEKEFDDWSRGFVNQENEAKFRDLYTKAYGMDFYKQKYGKINDSFKTYKEKYEPLVKTWNELSEVYNQGDLDTFFKGLKIPEDKIYQYVLDKLNERDLTHEQRLERQSQTDLKRRAYYLERENRELQSRYQTEQTQARDFQLSQALMKPEYGSIAKSFDERMGRPGAFREEVIKRGVLAFHATGQDISPDQAVQEVMSLLGIQSQPQQTAHLNSAQDAQTQQRNPSPPVIPNVGARSSSPAKKSPRSLADLRKLADTM